MSEAKAEGRTAEDRGAMIVGRMMALQTEVSTLKAELRQAVRDGAKHDELRAAALEANARAEVAEVKAKAWHAEAKKLAEAGFLPEVEAELHVAPAGELWKLAKSWLDKARVLDKEEGDFVSSGRRETLRECAAAMQRLSRKLKREGES